MIRRLVPASVLAVFLIASCGPLRRPQPITETTRTSYEMITGLRQKRLQTAAFLIDLRVNNAGEKYSVTTELYFAGDSIGLYGRGYLGKGTFKGQIINDVAMVYFSSSNEYYSSPLTDAQVLEVECATPGEALLSVLSLLAGKATFPDNAGVIYPSRQDIRFQSGRFDRTVRVDDEGFPESEKFIDAPCGDSIVINYYMHSREFPFYQVTDMLYYNTRYDFRARGFIREQKYNIDLPERKFSVDVPPDAVRLESL